MPVTAFNELMEHARRERYAVGYFESWNLESLLAVADAAEVTQSPVLLGFSGIYLSHPYRLREDPTSIYATMGLEVCHRLTVPGGLVFNESPDLPAVHAAMQAGFTMVMYSNAELSIDEQAHAIEQLVREAHAQGVAVEAEIAALPGVAGDLDNMPDDARLTDVDTAVAFVRQTGVDALAVNVGQAHLHGRRIARLDLGRLSKLDDAIPVPLALHGASSIHPQDLAAAIMHGVRKINVGSALKQVYFEALRGACDGVEVAYNPYEVIGSGLDGDVLIAGRVALQKKVEELMHLFGSAGKARRSL
jgi:fructose/tagatose bisphosphate aldolase